LKKRQEAEKLAESIALAQANIAGSSGDNVVQSLAQANIAGSSGGNVVQSFSMAISDSDHGEGDAPIEDPIQSPSMAAADLSEEPEFIEGNLDVLKQRMYNVPGASDFLNLHKSETLRSIAIYKGIKTIAYDKTTKNMETLNKIQLINRIINRDNKVARAEKIPHKCKKKCMLNHYLLTL
jgi:hypothetical protein